MRPFWAIFAACLALACLPFLTTAYPPLMDYSNHLARVFILGHWSSDAYFQHYYRLNWQPLPNLAFDVVGLLLNKVLPILEAGRITLLLAVVLMASGMAAVSRALHGRVQPWCLIGFLVLFSEPFAFGFVNLLLGFGLALWGLAGWLWLRGRPAWLVVACSVPFGIVLFFSHLFAFCSYAVVVGLLALQEDWRLGWFGPPGPRAWLVAGAQFVLPAVIMLGFSPTVVGPSTTEFGAIWPRLIEVPMAAFRNYSDPLDHLTALAMFATIGIGLWSRRLVIVREMRLPLIVLGVMCFFIPYRLAGSDMAVDRLPIFTLLFLAASGSWAFRWRWEPAMALALLGMLLLGRTGSQLEAFARSDRFVADVQSSLASLPKGARIGSMTRQAATKHQLRPEWFYATCYEVEDKSIFSPILFAVPSQHSITLVDQSEYPPSHYNPVHPMPPAEDYAHLDYMVIVNGRDLVMPSNLKLIDRRAEFDVYKVLS